MSDARSLNRRTLLKFMTAGAVLACARASAAAEVDTRLATDGSPSWVAVVDIPGAPEAGSNILDIALDELSIDAREMTTGADWDYRIYAPGDAHYGNATFTRSRTPGTPSQLQRWFEECSKGKNIRKNITVTLFKSDKPGQRTYNLMDCFPTQWSSVAFDTSSSVQTETIRVKVGRIEFKV